MDASEEGQTRREEVFKRAAEIFKDPDKVSCWLNTPNTALGGQTPMQMIETEDGVDVILNELGRIEQGIPI